MTRNWWIAILLVVPVLAAAHTPALGQDAAACRQAVSSFKQADPGIEKFFKGAAGYAVFPSVAKGGIGIGGAGGSGCAYQAGALIGEAELGGELQLSAQVSAVAVQAGASANAKYRDGVAVFTIAKTGFMYEASVGGQKFSFKPKK